MKTNNGINLHIEDMLKRLSKTVLFKYVDNYDDFNSAYIVSPKIGLVILVLLSTDGKFDFEKKLYIEIRWSDPLISSGVNVVSKLYNGTIPQKQDGEVDYEFIEKILLHYDRIG